jgi:anti-sigma B factor antagonist
VAGVDLRYEIEQVGSDVIVRLAGELDLSTADALFDVLLAAIGDNDATTIEVDLALVSFLDSSALAALVKGFSAAKQAGCQFKVTNAPGAVRRVLEVTGTLDELR